MERDYDIFECLPDGSVLWCGTASGLQNTRAKLDALLRANRKEYFALHLATREIVFAADASKITSARAAKRIFQIAYTDQLRTDRARLLRGLGYAVMSAMGNEAAKALLTSLHRDDPGIALFIVGHAAPAQTRREMVDWLKTNYASAKVLALNPPNQQVPDADYNVIQNGPEAWLPFVGATMNPMQSV